MSAILLLEPDATPWQENEFFQTGIEYWRMLMESILAPRGLPRKFGRALDFGCGIGRLSNALSRHFESVVGVDISSEMIRKASARRSEPNIEFLQNDMDHLRILPDDHFDFVLSVLVLQHIPPKATLSYVAEFLRVLKPGGTAVFQLPERCLIEDRGFLFDLWVEVRRVAYRPKRILEMPRRLPRLLRIEPRMEMRGIKRDEMKLHLAKCGGKLVDVLEDHAGGSRVRSFLYIVEST